MATLLVASCQAANAEYINRAVANWLHQRLSDWSDTWQVQYQVQYIDNIPWQSRYVQLDQAQLQVVQI